MQVKRKPFAVNVTGDPKTLYEQAMGRTWSEIDPAPQSDTYGLPDPPPSSEDPAVWELWNDIFDTWLGSDERDEWHAACDRYEERRRQFSYTGRKRGDKEYLASLVALVEMVAA